MRRVVSACAGGKERAMSISFADPQAIGPLGALSEAEQDALSFGLIVMSRDGVVVAYNRAESELSRLSPARVIGRHFFQDVAPCTNNSMIAQRFDTEPELDATLDYIFTLRMAPTPVRLRMLRSAAAPFMYLLVERRHPDGN
jgi:photoactive yellow protein